MRTGPVVLYVLAAAACGPSSRGSSTSDARVMGGDVDAPVSTPVADAWVPDIFPTDPIIEAGAPGNSGVLFGDPSTGAAGGPCLIEPDAGTLYPLGFLRPRFRLAPGNGQNLFEIRLRAASVDHDLVAYTTESEWTVPAKVWTAMGAYLNGQPITFLVRGARYSGGTLVGAPLVGSTGTFRIAPVAATGSIVYWTNGDGHNASFKGFKMGDETVAPVLTPAQGGVVCVGCHTSTPDGKFVSYSAVTDAVAGDKSSIDLRSLDGQAARPSFLSASAATLLARTPNQEAPIYSKAHWSAGDHVALSMFPVAARPEIIWTNLEATSTDQGVGWGVVVRDGDVGQAGAAAWSHDGKTIAYSSGPLVTSGMNLDKAHGDIYTVPFAGGKGGAATPLPGASDPAYTEHYAAFSSDDALLAFTRVGASENPYNAADSEVFVLPSSGGTPVRLRANDPSLCTAATSPGVHNTWPKWSPASETASGVRYYWLTFSSTRAQYGVPQLYVAPITVDAAGTITSYPALYLWNQPADEHNHTPAWDAFDIPPVN